MSLLSKLFGARTSSVRTTVNRPLRLSEPTIGFLNLSGTAAAQLLEADSRALGSLFSQTRVSDTLPPPQCDVLFIYCSLNPQGNATDATLSPRNLIKAARAYIAVFASENDPNAYIKCMRKRTDWGANIVMVVNRNGEKFAQFFTRLFTAMYEGQTMPMAWIQLAPQGPSPKHDENPSSIFSAEAGHITFARSADNTSRGR